MSEFMEKIAEEAFYDELEKMAYETQDYYRKGKDITSFTSRTSSGKGFKKNESLGPDKRGRYTYEKSVILKPGTSQYQSAIKSLEKSDNRKKGTYKAAAKNFAKAGVAIGSVAGLELLSKKLLGR